APPMVTPVPRSCPTLEAANMCAQALPECNYPAVFRNPTLGSGSTPNRRGRHVPAKQRGRHTRPLGLLYGRIQRQTPGDAGDGLDETTASRREEAMRGLMSEQPLLISMLIQHAANFHGDVGIVSRTVDGVAH